MRKRDATASSDYDHADITITSPTSGNTVSIVLIDHTAGVSSTLLYTFTSSVPATAAAGLAAAINAANPATYPEFKYVTAFVAPSNDLASGLSGVRLVSTIPLDVSLTNGTTTTLAIQSIHTSSSTDAAYGETTSTYYDSVGRAGKTIYPDGTATKLEDLAEFVVKALGL